MDNDFTSQQIKNKLETLILEAIWMVLDKLTADIAAMRKSTSEMKF
jgi:hypothetical protein